MNFSKNKFGSKKKKDKPKLDGYIFDSKPEINRYIELRQKQRTGEIANLEVHPKFILKKGIKNNHDQHIYQWNYKADFKYYCVKKKTFVVEDVKSKSKCGKYGTSTLRDYKLTRNEFMRLNPDIYFKEVYY